MGFIVHILSGMHLVAPAWQLVGMSKPTPHACKTRRWPVCTEALRRRGLLTIHWPVGDFLRSPQGWFVAYMIWEAAPTGQRGRQPAYSNPVSRVEVSEQN